MPDIEATEQNCTWDTQPIGMSMWISALEDHLSSIHSDYDTLVSGGYAFSSRNQVACQSPAHAWLLAEQMMPTYDFKDPCPLIIDSDPTLAGLFTASTWTTIPDEFKHRYDVKPEFLSQRHVDMGKDILKTITTQAGRKLWRDKAKPTGAGVVMLTIAHAEVRLVSRDADDAIALKLYHLEQTGITHASVKAWNDWKEEYEEWLAAATIPPPDAAIAQRFVRVASALGQVVEDKLEVRLEMTNGHNDRALTVAAINAVLQKIETKKMSDDLTKALGGAHAAADPYSRARDPGSNDPTPPKPPKRPPPSPCPEPGCGAMHWRSDCPKAKARKTKEKRNARGAASTNAAGRAADAATIASLKEQLKQAAPTAPQAPSGGAGGGAAALPDELRISDTFFAGGEQVVHLPGLGAAGLSALPDIAEASQPTAADSNLPNAGANDLHQSSASAAATDARSASAKLATTRASRSPPVSRPPSQLTVDPGEVEVSSDSGDSDEDDARKVSRVVVLDREATAADPCHFWSIAIPAAAGVYYGRWSSVAPLVAGFKRQGDSRLPKDCRAYHPFSDEQSALDDCLLHAQALSLDLSEYELSPELRPHVAASDPPLPPPPESISPNRPKRRFHVLALRDDVEYYYGFDANVAPLLAAGGRFHGGEHYTTDERANAERLAARLRPSVAPESVTPLPESPPRPAGGVGDTTVWAARVGADGMWGVVHYGSDTDLAHALDASLSAGLPFIRFGAGSLGEADARYFTLQRQPTSGAGSWSPMIAAARDGLPSLRSSLQFGANVALLALAAAFFFGQLQVADPGAPAVPPDPGERSSPDLILRVLRASALTWVGVHVCTRGFNHLGSMSLINLEPQIPFPARIAARWHLYSCRGLRSPETRRSQLRSRVPASSPQASRRFRQPLATERPPGPGPPHRTPHGQPRRRPPLSDRHTADYCSELKRRLQLPAPAPPSVDASAPASRRVRIQSLSLFLCLPILSVLTVLCSALWLASRYLPHGWAGCKPSDQLVATTSWAALLGSPTAASTAAPGLVKFIVDSGCCWHVINNGELLVNKRPGGGSMYGADGVLKPITAVGDLPIACRDANGRVFERLLPNVRCVPKFTVNMLSVGQLWLETSTDTRFGDLNHLELRNGSTLPFQRANDGLYYWNVSTSSHNKSLCRLGQALPARPTASPDEHGRACVSTAIRKGTAHSHFDVMSPHDLTDHLHRRLHVGHEVIKRLHEISSDVPDAVARCTRIACPHCAEANATLTSHKAARYRPSRPGQLIHADIAGPFKPSTFGQYRYALVLIDDHSRFKWVYFMQHKSDAPGYVRAFLSSFSSILRKKHGAVGEHTIGAIHTDNAGEFLSREFTDLLDKDQIAQTTCPPHVHALNGVAERAIRTIFSLARSNLVASHAPIGFWPQAVRHALDVANRVHGPPGESNSSFELVTDTKPKVLGIMPFGCRAFAVKARPFLSKTNIDAHAWVGVNVGRSARSPGAYDVWVPSVGRLVTTSEVYFDETLFPWRPKEDQRSQGSAVTPPPPPDDGSGFIGEPAENRQLPSSPPDDNSLPVFADLSQLGRHAPLPSSRKALILFSGSYTRRDSFKAYLEQLGLEADLVDNDARVGGGAAHDILDDVFFNKLLHRVRRGDYFAIFAAPPCSTFSISRFFSSKDSPDGGPPPVRSKTFIHGLPSVPAAHRRELDEGNEIVRRTALLLTLGHAAGSEFIIEHPCDRSDKSLPTFIHEDHGSIWQMPEIKLLSASTGATSATFAQCRFDCDAEKATTVLYTAGLAPQLAPLDRMRCQHGRESHRQRAGGSKDDATWGSQSYAAYPAALNLFFAQALFQLARSQVLRGGEHSRLTPTIPPSPLHRLHHESEDSRRNAPADRSPESAPALEPPQSPPAAPPHDLGDSSDLPLSPAARPASRPPPEPDGAVRRPGQLRGLGSGRAHTRSQGPALASLAVIVLRAGAALTTSGSASLSSAAPALAARPSSADPLNFAAAIKADPRGWRASMVKELLNHEANQSWEWIDACDVPHDRRLVKFTWVYKTKRDGTMKSRLCVQGCTQVAGIDYDQTFCATMRATSVRVLASLGARFGLRMRRWDFTAAYLQGSLVDGEVVYCKPPPGYEDTDVHGRSNLGRDGKPRVAKVTKPIYGMAQAGRRWQRSLFPWLIAHGFTACSRDPCVFHKEKVVKTPAGDRHEKLVVGCYVDDLLTLYSHDDELSLYHRFITELQREWKVEDEGETSDLLNVQFEHDPANKSVTLHQRDYIEKMMEQHCPQGVPPRFQRNSAPAHHELPQLVSDAQALFASGHVADPTLLRQYQGLVGSLLYCSTNTRPDVAYATGMLCRAMACPTPELLEEARRVLYYLHTWRDIGLTYTASDLPLHGYSDSDWAVRHSTSGWTFQFNRATISWGSKKQASVALSSCEAEIMAASEAAKEAVYLRELLTELGVADPNPTSLAVDNQSAKALAHNPELHSRTKHIDRRHFYVREAVEEFRIAVPFVSTADNLADFFTKPLRPSAFFPLRDKLMNVSPSR